MGSEAYPDLCGMKQLGILLGNPQPLPPHFFVWLPWQFSINQLYSWVYRGLLTAECADHRHLSHRERGIRDQLLNLVKI